MNTIICPKCHSENVRDNGGKIGLVGYLGSSGEYAPPTEPLYDCNNCGELFALSEAGEIL